MIRSKVVKFGDNVDTDQIIGAHYLSLPSVKDMAPHTFEYYPHFVSDYCEGGIIAGGDNFGCGSSREQAPAVLKERGVSAVVAKSFARIFYRNAINLGIPLIECGKADQIRHGDELEIDMENGRIRNLTSGQAYEITPLPEFMKAILASGGIVPHLRKKG